MLPPRQAGIVRIAQTDVTYETLDAGSQRQSVDIILNYTNDQSISSQLNHQVMNIVEKVQAFKLQTQALSDAEGGNVGSATRKLRQAVTMLLNQGEEELAAQIQDEATQLEKHGELSSEGKKTIKLTSRKTVRLSDLES
jgi:Ca-activated chloride channel family protein